MDASNRVAILIDADNISSKHLRFMLNELAKHGNAAVRRAYGDWSRTALESWKKAAHDHAFHLVQQSQVVNSKNSSDMALVIDAMDLLYTEDIDIFCVASSDSDYTRLLTRLREKGKEVIGVGESKAPGPLVQACHRFIQVDALDKEGNSPEIETPKPSRKLGNLLTIAVDQAAGDDGWAHLAHVGNTLRQADPSFDVRTFGYGKLIDALEDRPKLFEVKKENQADAAPIAFVRKLPREGK